jgi:hypothetical protein
MNLSERAWLRGSSAKADRRAETEEIGEWNVFFNVPTPPFQSGS